MKKTTKTVSILLCFVMFISLFAVAASAEGNCTVIFDCKNGTKITLNGNAGDSVTAPADPSKTGAAFKNWEKSDGTAFTGGTYGALDGQTVYAVYDITAFDITFDKDEIYKTENPRVNWYDPANTENQIGRTIYYKGALHKISSWSFSRWKAEGAGLGVDGSVGMLVGKMNQTWAVNGNYALNDGYDFFTVKPSANYRFEMDINITCMTAGGLRLVLSPYVNAAKDTWAVDGSLYKTLIANLATPVESKDPTEYRIINEYGGLDDRTVEDGWVHIDYIFTAPAEFAEADETHPYPNLLALAFTTIKGDCAVMDNIKITETTENPPAFGDGTLKFYVGDELFYTAEEGTFEIDGPFPEIPLPEAPEGKYLKGFSTDPAGTKLYTANTVPGDAYKFYAVFADYKDTVTDDFSYTAGSLAIPYNYDGAFYNSTKRYGWSWRVCDAATGAARYYAYSTWGVSGVTIAADPDGGAAVLKPHSRYKMTVTVKVPKFKEESISYMLGYGLAPMYDHTDKNKFIYSTQKSYILAGTTGDETLELVYDFDTGTLSGMLPVAGIFIGTAPGSEIDVLSIKLERAQIDYSISNLELGGGFLDYDMTDSSDAIKFETGTEASLPEKAYRYRYAFAGWYDDAGFTEKSEGSLVDKKTYYAKWDMYGDVNGDGKVDNVDLIRAKKYFAGQNVEITAGTEVTGEGELSNTDIIRLKKYLAGMSVVLGPTRYLAFAFDDGPCEGVADLLDSFKKVNGHATFMVIGSKCSDSTKPYLERIIEEGSEIGNHSLTHGSLTSYTTKEQMKAAFTDCNKRVSDLLGGYEMKVGRLPNFAYDDTVLEAMREIKMPLMGNGITSNELDAATTAEMLFHNVVTQVKDGDILCMHATKTDTTVPIMDNILAELRADGYEFVTCSEMFEIKGYKSIPLGKNINRAEQQTKLIAFSFDDGPNESIYAMTDLFKEYGGRCSYTLVGKNITSDQIPGMQYALSAGCELANHSFTHTGMTTVSPAEAIADFKETDKALIKYFGITTKWARLPGNSGNDDLYAAAKEAGLSLISGTIFTTDWSGTATTAEDVAGSVRAAASDGGIADCHLTAKTVEAMRIILPELAAQGYRFVTVSELFEMNNYASIPVGAPTARADWQYG